MKYRVFILLAFVLALSIIYGGTPRALTQKICCTAPFQILDYVTNTGTTTSSNYIVRADILETTGEEVGTDLGTTAANLRLFKAGNGTTVPYYAAISVQLGQFATQWGSGNTLRFIVTYIPTNEVSAAWDIVIPTGSSAVSILDPVMTVPPTPIIELTPPEVQLSISEPSCVLSWNAVAGANSYHVYSSNEVHGAFSLVDTTTQTNYIMPMTSRYEFFKVTSTNNRLESSPSDVIGFIKTDCLPGLNLIALPLGFDQTNTSVLGNLYNASQTLISQIAVFDESINEWDSSVYLGAGYWSPVLPITQGDVVFVCATQAFTFYNYGVFIPHQTFTRFVYNEAWPQFPAFIPLDYLHGILGISNLWDIYYDTFCDNTSFWNAEAQAWWTLCQLDLWGEMGGSYLYTGFDWVGNPFVMSNGVSEVWPDWTLWTIRAEDHTLPIKSEDGGEK